MREMCFPDYSAERCAKGLRLRFVIPHSRFGPVEIVLAEDTAVELAHGLIAMVRSAAASPSPETDEA